MLAPGAGTEEAKYRRGRPETYLFFLAIFVTIGFLTHAFFLDMPYHWDEAGQFVLSARDIYEKNLWVPQRTLPNVHPPAIPAYVAAAWSLFGTEIETTRSAMLALSGLGLLGVFALAIRLLREAPGAQAFLAVLLMAISPLFFIQAMLAQLDMPAMVFTVWALYFFLRERIGLAVLCTVVLVLVKETGIVVPVVLAIFLWRENRKRDALLFAIPVAALAIWLVVLRQATGHWLGNPEFAQYNVSFALDPGRIVLAMLRRVAYLFLENFHWIGWLAVAAGWKRGLFRGREWKVAAAVSIATIIGVTVLGGAGLERYLLPAMPIMYIAMAAGLGTLARTQRMAGTAVLAAGLIVSLFWNPPFWPAPQENNLAIVDFVALQKQAADALVRVGQRHTITTAWPLSMVLQKPELGYVETPLAVEELPDFREEQFRKRQKGDFDVLVIYSRDWDPPWSLMRLDWARAIAEQFLGWKAPITPQELEDRFGLQRRFRWERRGQWMEVLTPGE